jgi:hypothetical protein
MPQRGLQRLRLRRQANLRSAKAEVLKDLDTDSQSVHEIGYENKGVEANQFERVCRFLHAQFLWMDGSQCERQISLGDNVQRIFRFSNGLRRHTGCCEPRRAASPATKKQRRFAAIAETVSSPLRDFLGNMVREHHNVC